MDSDDRSDVPRAPAPASTAGEASDAAGAPGAQAPPSAAPRPDHRRRNRTLVAVGGAVGVAVLGATASAVITPERIDAIFGGFGSAGGSVSATSTPAPLEYKTVVSDDRALTVDIPVEWGAGLSKWDATAEPGSGLRTGREIRTFVIYESDGAYLGASGAAAAAADASSLSEPQRRAFLRSFLSDDWGRDGCDRDPDPRWEKPGWTIESSRWTGCATFEGERFFEFAALDEGGAVLVLGQINLTADAPDEIADRHVESFVVDDERLPGYASGDLVAP